MAIRGELLFHQEPITGHQSCQLVLLSDRRSKVLKIAHDLPWAENAAMYKVLLFLVKYNAGLKRILPFVFRVRWSPQPICWTAYQSRH